ncbi:MAG: hypothetical protein LBR60_08220 [Fibrobacter sp.]|jgi:hypothetical protein|nr:hypothetical protein [Fibrobacter sp.]
MQKKWWFITLSLLLIFACSEPEMKQEKQQNFTGFWQNELNQIFEVAQNSEGFVVQNINGGFQARIVNDTLTGVNTLGMPFHMTVKGDSAFYEFGSVVTGYKRINETEYRHILSTMQSNTTGN